MIGESLADCCLACRKERLRGASFIDQMSQTMLTCPFCGDKRCPRAKHHGNSCARASKRIYVVQDIDVDREHDVEADLEWDEGHYEID